MLQGYGQLREPHSLTREPISHLGGTPTGKNGTEAVHEIWLGPTKKTSAVISQGNPNVRVAGKNFAIFQINRHGDGAYSVAA